MALILKNNGSLELEPFGALWLSLDCIFAFEMSKMTVANQPEQKELLVTKFN
jgi:hypothetical protein